MSSFLLELFVCKGFYIACCSTIGYSLGLGRDGVEWVEVLLSRQNACWFEHGQRTACPFVEEIWGRWFVEPHWPASWKYFRCCFIVFFFFFKKENLSFFFFPVEDNLMEMPDISLCVCSLLMLVRFFSLLQEDILSAKPLTCLLHSAWGLFICCIAALSVCASLNLWQAALLTQRGEILEHEGLLNKVWSLITTTDGFG